jgi:RNA polymerase sigma-70 factor (ECF subfamily)
MESQEVDTEREASTSGEMDLVLRAQSGDADAFAGLVRQYQRRAVSLAYRLVSNSEDAGDVSQEAFIRAYRHLEQLDDPSRFGAWFLRIVSNLALNYRRARKGRRAASLDESLPLPEDARRPATGLRITEGHDREAGPLSDELQTAITKAVERLPDKQRLALVLFSVEGVPQKEVAEILECSVELIKWNVFQARRKLKDMLKEHL